MAAPALRLLILTACRISEILNARWSGIDLDEAIWTIHAERMKAGREHRAPLSKAGIALLKQVKGKHDEFIFPGPSDTGPFSNMALLMLLWQVGRDHVTVHGMRSPFRDWAFKYTNFSNEVGEMALAHVEERATEVAYGRGDLFEKRSPLMEVWASYCEPAGSAKALPLNRKQWRRWQILVVRAELLSIESFSKTS